MTPSTTPPPSKAVDILNSHLDQHLLKGGVEERVMEKVTNHTAKVIKSKPSPETLKEFLTCLSQRAGDQRLSISLRWKILKNIVLIPHAFNAWINGLPASDVDNHLKSNIKDAASSINLFFILSLSPNSTILLPSLLRSHQMRQWCIQSLSEGHWLNEGPYQIRQDSEGLQQLSQTIVDGDVSWSKALHQALNARLHQIMRAHNDMYDMLRAGENIQHLAIVFPHIAESTRNNLAKLDQMLIILKDACDPKSLAKMYATRPQSKDDSVDVSALCPFLFSQWSRYQLASNLPDGAPSPKSKM